MEIHELLDENYIQYTELEGNGRFKIKLFCVNPAENLNHYLKLGNSTIFFSATLLPIDYYKQLLSVEKDDYAAVSYTHLDVYKRQDHNLLKLDILGHDDPTMIRTLEDYITSDAMENEYNEEHPFVATDIPLDDKKVIDVYKRQEFYRDRR